MVFSSRRTRFWSGFLRTGTRPGDWRRILVIVHPVAWYPQRRVPVADLAHEATQRMSAEDITVWRNMAVITLIVAALQFLSVTLCREWVKNDLRQRACKPISVR